MNKLELYSKTFKNKYSNQELISYLNNMKHSDNCQRELKTKFHAQDNTTGQIVIDDDIYRVYSCRECGGNYNIKDS